MENTLRLDRDAVSALLPKRKKDSHKGDYGKLLLLCGSRGYTGAAYLAAMGALRCGAGLVYLGVPESIYQIEAVKLTEPVVLPLPDKDGCLSADSMAEISKLLPKMDAVLIGCGLGQTAGTLAVLHLVLQSAACPVVVDADGISLVGAHKDILRGRTHPTIFTPHDGEFARLAGHAPGENRLADAAALARALNSIVLLKGYRTVITDGNTYYVNHTGNPGMAVGGSGDLLAGMIVSLIGQGLDPLEAAAVAAWLHGRAGDVCAEKLGQYGMLPTDMLTVLPQLFQ